MNENFRCLFTYNVNTLYPFKHIIFIRTHSVLSSLKNYQFDQEFHNPLVTSSLLKGSISLGHYISRRYSHPQRRFSRCDVPKLLFNTKTLYYTSSLLPASQYSLRDTPYIPFLRSWMHPLPEVPGFNQPSLSWGLSSFVKAAVRRWYYQPVVF